MCQDPDVWDARLKYWTKMYEEFKAYEPRPLNPYGAMYSVILGDVKNIIDECERELNGKTT